MGKVFDHITDDIKQFIAKQHIFFVASAPLEGGHVNVSPKGMDSFRLLGGQRVGYLDMTGSGNETSAHLAENGRITLMFCAFEGSPNVVRLYGKGYTVLPDTPEWDELIPHFTMFTGTRQLIIADIDRVSTACGYAVPFFDYKSERETLVKYWDAKEDTLPEYHEKKNFTSIDGLSAPISTKQG